MNAATIAPFRGGCRAISRRGRPAHCIGDAAWRSIALDSKGLEIAAPGPAGFVRDEAAGARTVADLRSAVGRIDALDVGGFDVEDRASLRGSRADIDADRLGISADQCLAREAIV